MKTLFFIGLLVLVSGCEYNDVAVNKEIAGNWTLDQIYVNDHWGGALSWRTTNFSKQVKFTEDLKYFSKSTGDFALVGTYRKISNKEIEITWDKPSLPQYPTYVLSYTVDSDGRLTLPTGTTEGIVLEKYKRTLN